MFAFMHPFQTIRRLEHEVTELRTQLATEKSVHGCRAISLMTPVESISMLQSKGADMLASLSTGAELRIPANVTGHYGDRDRFAHGLHAGESFVR